MLKFFRTITKIVLLKVLYLVNLCAFVPSW